MLVELRTKVDEMGLEAGGEPNPETRYPNGLQLHRDSF